MQREETAGIGCHPLRHRKLSSQLLKVDVLQFIFDPGVGGSTFTITSFSRMDRAKDPAR